MSGASDDVKAKMLEQHLRAAADFGPFEEAPRSFGPGNPEQMRIDAATKPLHVKIEKLQAEVDRLTLLINTPRTDDFFEAVRIEAAHQVERWGVEHDAGKRAEDWFTLYQYLLGKAAKAHFEGNREKLLHHVITVGVGSTELRAPIAPGEGSMPTGMRFEVQGDKPS